MSWGVATQNGVSVSLASIVSLSCGATEFSPASLFTSGVAGAWYDPSDYSTLFQDSAGTTPVTAVEQPVRLMLDKSQGLVLGSELVTGAASAYTGNGTVSTVGDTVTATCTTNGIYGIRWTSSNISNIWTRCTFEVVTNSASKSLNFYPNLAHAGISVGTTTGSKTYTVFAPTASGGNQIPVFFISGLAGESFSIRLVSIKELPGNHALAPNDLSRPVLRARYNQVTYSEQIDNAAWNKGSIVTTGSWTNQLTAPDGTLTADLVRPNNVSGTHYALLNSTLASAAGTYTCSLYVYAGGYTKFALRESASTGAYVSFDIATVSVIDSGNAGSVTISSSSITAVPGYPGWYRAVVTYVYSAGITPNLGYWPLPTSYTTGQPASVNWAGDGTSGIYIWGAQIVTGTSAGTYQRIAAATDYATTGFLPYLYFVTDDSFGTNSIDFTATDKMSVCAGVTKLSDAASAMVAELSANAVLNAGAFNIQAPATGGNAEYRYGGGGTIFRTVLTSSYAAPITNVLAAIQDIVGDSMNLRVNGVSVGTSALDQGTGNFGNYPLFIGRRNNSSLPFNGNLYQLIVCGKTLSASELASTEAYVNARTGAY